MSHTRKMRNRHPYKRTQHAQPLRFQTALHGQTCEICAMPLRRKSYFTDLYSIICRACFVKEALMPLCSTTDLTAFCMTLPAAAEVTGALASLGFALTFQMKADTDQAYLHLAPLPAQYHYRDSHGTEVIYLVGVDHEDEQPAPPHASRFWLYAGADAGAHQHTAQVLTATWQLTWLPLEEVPVEQQPSLDAVA